MKVKFSTGKAETKDLILKTPREVLNGIENHPRIKKWHRKIIEYKPNPYKPICLMLPCTTKKPFRDSITYKSIIPRIKPYWHQVHIVTMSDPMGPVPWELEDEMPLYDSPGLFEWWVRGNKLEWDNESYRKCILKLSRIWLKYLKNVNYEHLVCYNKSRIGLDTLKEIQKKFKKIIRLPSNKTKNKIVRKKGRLYWDIRGLQSEEALKELENKISQLTRKMK